MDGVTSGIVPERKLDIAAWAVGLLFVPE